MRHNAWLCMTSISKVARSRVSTKHWPLGQLTPYWPLTDPLTDPLKKSQEKKQKMWNWSYQDIRQSIKVSDTLGDQPTAWQVPYTCAQLYNPGSGSHGQLFRKPIERWWKRDKTMQINLTVSRRPQPVNNVVTKQFTNFRFTVKLSRNRFQVLLWLPIPALTRYSLFGDVGWVVYFYFIFCLTATVRCIVMN